MGARGREFKSPYPDMLVNEIPQEIIDFLDRKAGKKHSSEGIVLETLAEILTIYDFLKELEIKDWERAEAGESGQPVKLLLMLNEFESHSSHLHYW